MFLAPLMAYFIFEVSWTVQATSFSRNVTKCISDEPGFNQTISDVLKFRQLGNLGNYRFSTKQ